MCDNLVCVCIRACAYDGDFKHCAIDPVKIALKAVVLNAVCSCS